VNERVPAAKLLPGDTAAGLLCWSVWLQTGVPSVSGTGIASTLYLVVPPTCEYCVPELLNPPTNGFTPGTASVKLAQSKPLWQDALLAVVTLDVASDCCTRGMVTDTLEPLMASTCRVTAVNGVFVALKFLAR
jgi:hypothetical protein